MSIKLEVCHAALEDEGYGEDHDMIVEGDEEEVIAMIAAVERIAVDDKKAKPKVKKFKRELATLRGKGENFA